jgi:hypothetical protein
MLINKEEEDLHEVSYYESRKTLETIEAISNLDVFPTWIYATFNCNKDMTLLNSLGILYSSDFH